MGTEEKGLKKQQAQALADAERTRTNKVYVPRADIYETKDTIVLITDMAGVDEKSIDITLEKNVLTINGVVEPLSFNGYSMAYAEYDTGDYQRAFTISNEVDREKIEAKVKNGVLRVILHKAEQVKARKIAIKAA
ncbi:MAG: Hsp20/alpha crystallin family protein [Pseudomonadota bacterium]